MAEISIPGVSNKYGTNETIEKLMEVERVPLTREQNKLEVYKEEQSAWRDVNKQMTTLRENVRTLYSFDNPFNIKIASSTQEDAITADPARNADIGSFKINVDQIATADRFLSSDVSRSYQVPEGTGLPGGPFARSANYIPLTSSVSSFSPPWAPETTGGVALAPPPPGTSGGCE